MHRKKPFLIILFIFLTSLILYSSVSTPATEKIEPEPNGKKVIILIADYIDISDLINADTPNLDALISKCGTGLINIRSKNKYASSSYMSIAASTRVATIKNAGLSYNYDEKVRFLPGLIDNSPSTAPDAASLYTLFSDHKAPTEGVVNLFIEPAKKYASTFNPLYQVGSLGEEARALGLKVAILGNGDTYYSYNRDAVILAMDAKGIVPRGNVSRDLLEANPLSPGGLQTNHDQIITNAKSLLNDADILIIDLGDTTRVENSRANAADSIVKEQRKKAIERNDLLLGKIINSVDMNKTMLLLLTPNPNKDMLDEGNFGLTPLVMYTPSTEASLLTSNTTRRAGLVNSSDLKPTVFSYLINNYTDLINNYPDSGISTIKSDNRLEKLEQQLNLFKQLRASRNPLHYTFMTLSIIGIVLGVLAFIADKRRFLVPAKIFVYSSLSIPLIFLFISLANYSSTIEMILLSTGLALFIAGILYLLFQNSLNAVLFTSILTALCLLIDTFTGSRFMLVSPLGSDAIAGGRFYGIGNDYMGVLLACTIIATVLGLDKFKHLALKPRQLALIGLLPLIVVAIAIGHPNYGANMGGFITAVVSIGFFYIIISNSKISFFKVTGILLLAVLAVFSVAHLDAILNPSPSHAGKAISSLNSAAGLTVIISIIKTKLTILGSTVYNSSWSLVLLLLLFTLVLLKRKAPNLLSCLAKENRSIIKTAKILSISALVVFVVNDTGVIAAALILLYMVNCLWLALSRGGVKDGA